MITFEQLREKTLTPAEKKKREEIAKAMERENPGMDKSKKMAIATATAKRVAEANKKYAPGHIGAIQKMLDKECEAKKAKDAVKKEQNDLAEAETMYVIKHKKTKQVLSTHDNYETAKDEYNGLGADKVKHGIYKQTKKDAALRNRNTYREEVELDEISRDLATRAAQGFADKADKAHAKKDYAGFKKGEAGRKLAIAKVQGRAKVSAVARRVEEVELDEVSTDKLRDYASAALQDKDKAKADKRWKYASKAMKTVGDREAKAANDLKYNKK